MRFRKLRIGWSVGCGIACVLLVVLWVRSYCVLECVFWSSDTHDFYLASNAGEVGFQISGTAAAPINWEVRSFQVRPHGVFNESPAQPLHRVGGIAWSVFPSGWYASVSYAWTILLSFVLGIVPWIRWSKRFSLGTLLIAMTLVAVVLGLIVWMSRTG